MFTRLSQQKQDTPSLAPARTPSTGSRDRSATDHSAEQLSLIQRCMMRLGLLEIDSARALLPATCDTDPQSCPDTVSRPEPAPVQIDLLPPNRSKPLQTVASRDDTARIEAAIRERLPELSPIERRQYQRMLDNLLIDPELPARTRLFHMVAARVNAAARRERAAPPAPTIWRALPARARISGDGVVADLLRKKERELLDLRFAMLRLPPDLLLRYQSVLADLLASEQHARRNSLLARMTQQVARSARRNEQHPDFRAKRESRA